MKKILSLVLLAAFFATANFSNAQVYEKGNFVFDAYYGFPNLLSAVVRSSANTYENSKVTTIGPVGVTGEYLFSSRFGLGLEASYMSINAKYSESYFSGNGFGTQTANYEDTYTRFRVLPRANFHFGNSSKVDPYLTFGVGYANFKETHKVDGATYGSGLLDFTTPGNVSSRVGFGVRYFFTDNFGVMAEGGIGGALLRFGLSAKF